MTFEPKMMAYCMAGMPRRSIDEACDVMIRYFPEITTIPMPTQSQRIWTERTPLLKIDREKKQIFFEVDAGRDGELVEFYEKHLAEDWEYFGISPDLDPTLYALAERHREKPWAGLHRIHFGFPGLYSWGLSIKDNKGKPALYNPTLRDVMIKTLSAKARWRERKIQELFPGVETMVTVGDGALSVYLSAGGTGAWEEVKQDYNAMMKPIQGISVIHCCSNFDWSLLMSTDADVINFDAYQYGETLALYADALEAFLERGGMIAWGIVPTAGAGGDVEKESPESLVDQLERLLNMMAEMGIDRQQLLAASWITPTCTTNTLTPEHSDRVYAYSQEVSQIMRERYFEGDT